MEDKARGKIIHERQPFGVVHDHYMHQGDAGMGSRRNALGGINEVENRGISVAISNADKNPSAYAKACAHRDNPFAFVGMPEKRAHGNSMDPRMHISEEVS